ncbi:hypothetical protein KA405_01655 [Patescibacteria group bacterium]|nr:hypothetical protein [Patescibacteria group bacterium]
MVRLAINVNTQIRSREKKIATVITKPICNSVLKTPSIKLTANVHALLIHSPQNVSI